MFPDQRQFGKINSNSFIIIQILEITLDTPTVKFTEQRYVSKLHFDISCCNCIQWRMVPTKYKSFCARLRLIISIKCVATPIFLCGLQQHLHAKIYLFCLVLTTKSCIWNILGPVVLLTAMEYWCHLRRILKYKYFFGHFFPNTMNRTSRNPLITSPGM